MLYSTENTIYCMQLKLRGKNLGNSLRYGIAHNNLKTVKIYDYKYKSSMKKYHKYIRRYIKVEEAESLHRTSRSDTTCEGKKQSKVVNKSGTNTNTKKETKLKYVQIVPHQYCPGNFVILEILPQPADENNNSTVPETTATKRVTDKIPRIVKGTRPKRLNSARKNLYNKVLKTLKIQKTSPIWEIWKRRRKFNPNYER